MYRGMDLTDTLRETVALIGQIEDYNRFFMGNGGTRLYDDRRALPRAEDIIARFHDLLPTDQDGKRWALFRDCQMLVNPVQSNLQGTKDHPPALQDLLARIISLKSEWAALERYPHAVLHRSVH